MCLDIPMRHLNTVQAVAALVNERVGPAACSCLTAHFTRLRAVDRLSTDSTLRISGKMDVGGESLPIPKDNVVDLSAMRVPYHNSKDPFLESDLKAYEPIGQFKHWFDETCSTPGIKEPNAVALATSTPDGRPSCRMVLLKGFSKQGFRFFTNYESRKGSELENNPRACMMFYWDHKDRSVRIEGIVEKLTEEESTEYFQQRPVGSQVAATVSRQSSVVPDRDFLADQAETLYARSEKTGHVLPRPSFWGGYNLVPETVEFWQGQTNRLHDRICFRRPSPGETIDQKLTHTGEDGWVFERLSP